MAKKPSSTKDEATAIEWLKTKFAAPEFACLAQVPDGTGIQRNGRTADAVIMSLWPSRGLKLYGVEYKRYRGDWLRELKQPSKAESIGQHMHFWYVLAPAGLINPMEVPAQWGLWEYDGADRLLRTREAQENPNVQPLTYNFLAGVLRAASNVARQDPAQHAALSAEYRRGYKDGAESRKYEIERLEAQLVDVREFEAASGIRVASGWNHGKLGDEVRELLKILTDPTSHQYTAGSLLGKAFELYRASLDMARALGLGEDEIAKKLKGRT